MSGRRRQVGLSAVSSGPKRAETEPAQEKTVMLCGRVPESLRDAVAIRARQDHKSVAQLLEDAVRAYLES